MTETKQVLLAMSGGIDSSVSAILLNRQGYEVTGIYFDLWKYKSDKSASREIALKNIEEITKLVGIRYIVEDIKLRFKDKVVNY